MGAVNVPTPLEQYPHIRQWAYRLLWIVGLAMGALQVWFTTTPADDQPSWILPALAVLAYVSIATNYTADRNVSPTTVEQTPPEDRGYVGEDAEAITEALKNDPEVHVKADDPGDLGLRLQEQDRARSLRRDDWGFVDNNVVVTIAAIVIIIVGLIYIVRAL